jgi:hypothetical protein
MKQGLKLNDVTFLHSIGLLAAFKSCKGLVEEDPGYFFKYSIGYLGAQLIQSYYYPVDI